MRVGLHQMADMAQSEGGRVKIIVYSPDKVGGVEREYAYKSSGWISHEIREFEKRSLIEKAQRKYLPDVRTPDSGMVQVPLAEALDFFKWLFTKDAWS